MPDKLLDAVINEPRLKILQYIQDEPHYISQIVEQTNLSRPAVCFHLNVLERAKIVESEYRVLEPPHSPSGKAARFYKVNKTKLKEAMSEMNSITKTIRV